MSLTGFRFVLFIALNTLFFGGSYIYAQELEPRAYSNIPMGLNFVLAGYGYSEGGVLFDPAVPLDNASIKTHGAIFAYAHSIRVGSMSGKVDVILPHAWLAGTADYQGQEVSREVSGFGDSRIRMSVNLLGAPALSLSEFKDYKQNLIVGASLQVSLPLSQYDNDRLVNIGTNRYSFKPELGISKRIHQLLLEMSAGVTFYTKNDDFYPGQTRSQARISSIQGHAIYNFKKGIWAALDGTYYWGGKTTTDGAEGNDLQSNTRFGLIVAVPISLRHSLKLTASTGVSTRTGSDFDAIMVAWQYRWGKGLPK